VPEEDKEVDKRRRRRGGGEEGALLCAGPTLRTNRTISSIKVQDMPTAVLFCC
jgi:hypothetical protein